MNIIVNEELKAYIDPLTPDEYASLESSILAEGCRDALVLWGDVLIDGHNRYAICQAHGLPFQTVQNTWFKSMEDVHLWMIEQHLGRRSVSDFQRGVLALRKREIMAARRVRTQVPESLNPGGVDASVAVDVPPWEDSAPASAMDSVPLLTREDIAKAARLSSNQMVMIEKIQKQAAPEVVAALKSGDISLNAAAAVASLPAEEQVAAAVAGKDELKQAAKRVREAKRKPRVMPEEGADQEGLEVPECSPPADEVKALKQRIAQLEKENDALRKQVLNLLEKSQRMA
ncbi:plasmid replication/partition related protein [Rhodoferax lithotrophicus]|nr:plasmid replication/partition related protein [Rhodoferax sp. MIZ03]